MAHAHLRYYTRCHVDEWTCQLEPANLSFTSLHTNTIYWDWFYLALRMVGCLVKRIWRSRDFCSQDRSARSFIEYVLNCSCLLLCRFCISMITLTGRPSLWKVDLLISSTFGMFFDQHFCGSQSSQKLLMPLHSFASPGHRNNSEIFHLKGIPCYKVCWSHEKYKACYDTLFWFTILECLFYGSLYWSSASLAADVELYAGECVKQ